MSILGSPRIWAAIIGFAAVQPALAAPSASVFPDHRAQRNVLPPQAGTEQIVSTFVHNGDSDVTEAAGTFQQINSQNLTCPASAGTCTFTIAANVEASGGANASNQWAICSLVDGTYSRFVPLHGRVAGGRRLRRRILAAERLGPGRKARGYRAGLLVRWRHGRLLYDSVLRVQALSSTAFGKPAEGGLTAPFFRAVSPVSQKDHRSLLRQAADNRQILGAAPHTC